MIRLLPKRSFSVELTFVGLSKLLALALCSAVVFLLSGCSGREVRGSVTVLAPDLPVRTTLHMVLEPTPLQFRPYKQAVVDESHTARFTDVVPGLYRLVVYGSNGAPEQFSFILPVAPGENVVTYKRQIL